MLERKEYQRLTIDLEQNLVEKLNDTAKTFGVPRVQVIRACLEAELPRLIERERKRRKRKDTSKS